MQNKVFTNSVVTVIPDFIYLFSEENILSRKLVNSDIFLKGSHSHFITTPNLILAALNFAAKL
jgi:hypothetical protein